MRSRGVDDFESSPASPIFAAALENLENIAVEAAELVARPRFPESMHAFCRGLANFYARGFGPGRGVVDIATWATVCLVTYLDAASPRGANASQVVALCQLGPLAGATAVRNAIDALRHHGLIAVETAAARGARHRLRPTARLIDLLRDNLAMRLAAIEPIAGWPKPAEQWASTEGVLMAYIGANVEAYRQKRLMLWQDFPEVRGFMDRHSGYHVLLEALARAGSSPQGARVHISLSELADKFSISRAHVRKLFASAAARGWLGFEPGGRVSFSAELFDRYSFWIGYELAWVRRIAMTPWPGRPEAPGARWDSRVAGRSRRGSIQLCSIDDPGRQT